MAIGRSRRRAVPDRPSLPQEFVPAPADFGHAGDWDGVIADAALDLPDAVAGLSMTECVWRGVDAGSRTLRNLRGRDVVFQQCSFAGAVLDGAALTRVAFVECQLTGVVLSAAQLTDVTIDGGVADLANFRSSVCSRFFATGTSLKEADFYAARLRDCALLDSDLTSANFDAMSADGLSLHGSVVDAVRGATALAGGRVGIDAAQLVPLGAAVLAGLGVQVTERPR